MKNLWWAFAIGAVIVVTVAAGTAAATSALVSTTPKYPAACQKVIPCVNRHLNNLNARIHAQHLQIVTLQGQVATMSSQLDCYGWVKVSQYPHASTTSSGDLTPANGGTWLDLMRPDNPANNPVWALVVNGCVS